MKLRKDWPFQLAILIVMIMLGFSTGYSWPHAPQTITVEVNSDGTVSWESNRIKKGDSFYIIHNQDTLLQGHSRENGTWK